MAEQNNRVIAVGEVMVELARGGDGRFGMACGGDTFNTAVYLARAGLDVSYATALGDDRARPAARHSRARAPAGHQGGVRRHLPSLWLEGRPAAHPHSVQGGTQARRLCAADLR